MEKRKLSTAGNEAREQFITKRLKSVELEGSWHFMDSIEGTSVASYSRYTSCVSSESNAAESDTVVGLDNDDSDKSELKSSDTEEMASECASNGAESDTVVGLDDDESDKSELQSSDTEEMASECASDGVESDTVEGLDNDDSDKVVLQFSDTEEMASRCASNAAESGTVEGLENDVIDKFELQHSDTVEMASQCAGFCESGEPNAFEVGNIDDNRSEMLKQLSSEILNVKTTDDSSNNSNDMCGVLVYMQLVPSAIRTDIASYLSCGSLEQVQLTLENIHHFYHVASNLNLKQLKDSCLKFCRAMNQTTILSTFEGCGCKDDIEIESSTGYYRSQSVVSNPDNTEPPQYYVVFSKESVLDSKVKSKVKVMVIDTNERRKVYHHEVVKMRQFGDGFACCSSEVKGTPFVYVSGGEGSSQIVKRYDIILGRWEKCSKLIHGRSNHMMVTSEKGSIYVLGGAEVPCIEEYDVKTNKWTERASLATQVVSAVCIYFQKKIYVFGGRTVAGSVANVQCYDTETHKVCLLPNLPCPFEGGQVVTLNDCIYIATDQGHMICFNPADSSSFLCTQQPVQRKHFGMFVKYGRIYLVGGLLCNEEGNSKTVPQYRYNAEKDLWVEKYKLCNSFPVFSSCIINYEKKCCVIPFNESF